MEIANNKTARNTIININKIEKIIKMWKVIQFTTSTKTNSSIQTIDIPNDTSIPWNNIKGKNNVEFKSIDNSTLIEELIEDHNSHLLNQEQCIHTLLNGDANLQQITLAKVTKRYLESMTRNKEIIQSSKQ